LFIQDFTKSYDLKKRKKEKRKEKKKVAIFKQLYKYTFFCIMRVILDYEVKKEENE